MYEDKEKKIKQIQGLIKDYSMLLLYAKYWYLQGNNIFKDLNKIISVICGECERTNQDIIYQLLSILDLVCSYYRIVGKQKWFMSHYPLEKSINRHARLFNMDRETATAFTIIFDVFGGLPKEDFPIDCPKYGKGEPFRMSNKQGMTYKEMNRIAKQRFQVA